MLPTLAYAGFGRRLSAGLLDFTILFCINLGFGWIASQSKVSAMVVLPPLWLAAMLYEPVLHARFGATLGKFAVGVRVRRSNGDKVNWLRSVIRSSVPLLASTAWIFSVAPLTFALPAEDFHGQGWSDLFQLIKSDVDSQYGAIELVVGAWFWSEFATMLLKSKRRAIHDLLADTVVVKFPLSDA
jgi:uncharacterized RDD family membrane protein YckC